MSGHANRRRALLNGYEREQDTFNATSSYMNRASQPER